LYVFISFFVEEINNFFFHFKSRRLTPIFTSWINRNGR
jgi:hypothetical protein